jgi:hypothetical protein
MNKELRLKAEYKERNNTVPSKGSNRIKDMNEAKGQHHLRHFVPENRPMFDGD